MDELFGWRFSYLEPDHGTGSDNSIVSATSKRRLQLRWVKRTGYRNSLIARPGLFTVGIFAALVIACGSSNSPGNPNSPADTTSDAASTAQPTATSPSAVKSASPNPSSTTEIVFAPDFELPQAGGGTVRLSDIYSRANTVLVFYRGYF